MDTPSELSISRSKVVVIGDVAVDYILFTSLDLFGEYHYPPMTLGGTAVNAARAILESSSFTPIIVGIVGNDPEGHFIKEELRKLGVVAQIGLDEQKRTGSYIVIYGIDPKDRLIVKNESDNANAYNPEFILHAAASAELKQNDFILLMCHFVTRLPKEQSVAIFKTVAEISAKTARIVWDLVPHNMFYHISRTDFIEFCSVQPYAIVAEWKTISRLLGLMPGEVPQIDQVRGLRHIIKAEWLILRYGEANIEHESRYCSSGNEYEHHSTVATGFTSLPKAARRGFGDTLTLNLFERVFL